MPAFSSVPIEEEMSIQNPFLESDDLIHLPWSGSVLSAFCDSVNGG